MLQPLLWPMTHADTRHSELFQLTNRAEWHAAFCQLNSVDCTAGKQRHAVNTLVPSGLPCPRQWVSVATPLSCSAIGALTGRHCATPRAALHRDACTSAALMIESLLGPPPTLRFQPNHCVQLCVQGRSLLATRCSITNPCRFWFRFAHLARSPCDSVSV
jgi:hypothetical protein